MALRGPVLEYPIHEDCTLFFIYGYVSWRLKLLSISTPDDMKTTTSFWWYCEHNAVFDLPAVNVPREALMWTSEQQILIYPRLHAFRGNSIARALGRTPMMRAACYTNVKPLQQFKLCSTYALLQCCFSFLSLFCSINCGFWRRSLFLAFRDHPNFRE